MKKIFLLLCIPFFTACDIEDLIAPPEIKTGKVVLEVTCNATPFVVEYNNAYDNDVTETSHNNYWTTEFELEFEVSYYLQKLWLKETNLQSNEEADVYLRIGYKGNTAASFDGKVGPPGELLQAGFE